MFEIKKINKELRIALHLHLHPAPTTRLLEMFGTIWYVSWEENMQKLLRPEISTSSAHIQVKKNDSVCWFVTTLHLWNQINSYVITKTLEHKNTAQHET